MLSSKTSARDEATVQVLPAGIPSRQLLPDECAKLFKDTVRISLQRRHGHPIDCSRMDRLNSLALAITQWYRAAIIVRNRAKMVVQKTLAHLFVYPRERIEAVLACSHT